MALVVLVVMDFPAGDIPHFWLCGVLWPSNSDLSATVRELDGFMEQVWETSLPPHPILSPVDEA